MSKYPYIAHALGGVNGDAYTNSYEAFLLNYQLGHRVFEVDFTITEDGVPVMTHDINSWRAALPENADKSFTYDNFMSQQIRGHYHPIDIPRLVQIVAAHPDIYIVTDTKSIDKTENSLIFQMLMDEAKKTDPSILDRFTIQIYHEEMYDWVMDFYPWKSIIYTLYQEHDWTAEKVRDFVLAKKIDMVGYYYFALKPEDVKVWTDAGIRVSAYTTSDLPTVKDLRKMGASTFYTDFLYP